MISFDFDLKNQKLKTESDRSNLFGNLVGQISCLEDVKICLEIVEYRVGLQKCHETGPKRLKKG